MYCICQSFTNNYQAIKSICNVVVYLHACKFQVLYRFMKDNTCMSIICDFILNHNAYKFQMLYCLKKGVFIIYYFVLNLYIA